MMAKDGGLVQEFTYRIYIPFAEGSSGDCPLVGSGSDCFDSCIDVCCCFDSLCPNCVEVIDKNLKEGFTLPMDIRISISEKYSYVGLTLRFPQKDPISLCEKCAKAFIAWLNKHPYMRFSNNPPELLRDFKEEEEPKEVKLWNSKKLYP